MKDTKIKKVKEPKIKIGAALSYFGFEEFIRKSVVSNFSSESDKTLFEWCIEIKKYLKGMFFINKHVSDRLTKEQLNKLN